MATRFESLALNDPDVLGIRMSGAFGRGDRRRLMSLAEKCLDREHKHLVLDCQGLDSLGGGGAQVLADLQRQLQERGGEAVFVAPGEIIRRFLQLKFAGLPLRCFETPDDALAALRGPGESALPAPTPTAEKSGVEPMPDSRGPSAAAAATSPRRDLDSLLDQVDAGREAIDRPVRRTADLVTAAYVSVDDMLQAARTSDNPTVLGEALAMLLDSHDLATETIFCAPQGDRYVSIDGRVRLPAEGGVVASLVRAGRPLTLLDLEDGDLWDEESQLLEEMQPDLILPLVRDGVLTGIAFLQRGGTEREYGIREVFALDLLLRLLMGRPAEQPPTSRDAQPHAPAFGPPAPGPGLEALLAAKLELARGLQDAQDIPHFWQIFIARLRPAAEVSSLLFLASEEPLAVPFLAGEARRGIDGIDLRSERIRAFFRTLERPVEVVNMPASLRGVRDGLLERGLQWLIGLRTDNRTFLGALALGVAWRGQPGEPADEVREVAEIAGDALQRLQDSQNRADMSIGLLEALLTGDDGPGWQPDPVSRGTVQAVRLLSSELGLPPDQERDLVLGALLRNLGQAPGTAADLEAERLAGAAWEAYRAHPQDGERKLAELKAPAAVRDAVRHHHERFDGRGFPLGLRGRDIPLVARLVALAQHHALHEAAYGTEAALGVVQAEAGRALDPDLVEIFLKACRRRETVPVGS